MNNIIRGAIITLTLTAALGALGAASATAASEDILESRILKVGAKAPVFVAQSLAAISFSAQEYRLEDNFGKRPVMLFFWSFFCGPCREEMPVVQKVCEEIGLDKVAFVGVNLDGKGMGKAIARFLGDQGMKFTVVFDELTGVEYKIADPYGVAGTPTSYIIDLSGNIAYAVVGKAEAEDIKKVLDEILAKKAM